MINRSYVFGNRQISASVWHYDEFASLPPVFASLPFKKIIPTKKNESEKPGRLFAFIRRKGAARPLSALSPCKSRVLLVDLSM
jgi:hypothetical protein